MSRFSSSPVHRATRFAKGGALGAVTAQGSQALASLALQLVAANALGLEEFGLFAILYGVIVLLTGLSTGFVGDSLTVLDRHDNRIRSALQGWLVIIVSVASVVSGLVCAAAGILSWWSAAAFALAVATFLLEDILRRLLMAHLLFWRIVCVDMVSLVVSIAALMVIASAGPLSIGSFFLALVAGQLGGLVAAVALQPTVERHLVRPMRGGYKEVARYGVWRAAQQGVRPALLTGVRTTVGLLLGLAATGQLEAARIYAAPTFLFVTGLSSFLFASFAKDTATPLARLVKRADRLVLLLVAATMCAGGVFVAALPWLGPLIFGQPLNLWLCVGWLAYAVSVSAVTPYGALAAVRHHQVAVFACRVTDSVLSLTVVAVLLWSGASVTVVPFVLTAGSFLGGLAIRWLVLRPRSLSTGLTPSADDDVPAERVNAHV